MDTLWEENIERGYCTYDFIKNVMSLESVQGASASIEAIEVSCPESPYRKCSSKVFLNGVQVGFVLMIENNIPFTAEHLTAMGDVSNICLLYTSSFFNEGFGNAVSIYFPKIHFLCAGI